MFQDLTLTIARAYQLTFVQPGFAPLLEATSSLRKEQEEEGKLADRMHEQRIALQSAERKYAEVNRRLAETRATTNEDMSAEAVLEGARREAAEGRQLVKKTMPSSIESRKETLAKLSRMLSEPAKVGGPKSICV
jgi:DNA anti-recombination protein RmuC